MADITRQIQGMTEEEAKKLASSLEFVTRVVKCNGKYLPVTLDLRSNRINLVLEDNVVVESYIE